MSSIKQDVCAPISQEHTIRQMRNALQQIADIAAEQFTATKGHDRRRWATVGTLAKEFIQESGKRG